MWSPHSIFPKWAEPKYSCRAAQGVTEVLYTECYSLHQCLNHDTNLLKLVMGSEFSQFGKKKNNRVWTDEQFMEQCITNYFFLFISYLIVSLSMYWQQLRQIPASISIICWPCCKTSTPLI